MAGYSGQSGYSGWALTLQTLTLTHSNGSVLWSRITSSRPVGEPAVTCTVPGVPAGTLGY